MNLLVGAVSLYSRHFPFRRGKTRLQGLLVERLLRGKEIDVESRYGTKFRLVFPDDQGWRDLLFLRDFEGATSRCVAALLRESDVVFDVGANIGWYSYLVATALRSGECHAFEPLPSLFARLRDGRTLNDPRGRLILNDFALGELRGEATLHTFRGLHHGLTSLSSLGRSDFDEVKVGVDTVDGYMSDRGMRRLDVVKLDVEGAELAVLKGAQEALRASTAPVFILEMNVETSRAFGYEPRELLECLASAAAYEFVCIPRGWERPRVMSSKGDFRHGDNVIAVPKKDGSRMASVGASR